MKTKERDAGRPYFAVDGAQSGIKLDDRVKGLDWLRDQAYGKTVLDLGCAEGLISQWFISAGAMRADGIDYSTRRIKRGRALTSDAVQLHAADLRAPGKMKDLPYLLPEYDIVLILSVLQKLKRPDNLLRYAMTRCRVLLAIRIPSPTINDVRCEISPFDVPAYLHSEKFDQVDEHRGDGGVPWVGVFKRQ